MADRIVKAARASILDGIPPLRPLGGVMPQRQFGVVVELEALN